MTAIASDWLGLSLILCLAAWYAKRQLVYIFLPFAVMIAAYCIYLPTGSPRFTPPPKGDYTVAGYDIQVNFAIYVLLKEGSNPPVFYRMPYTNEAAGQLQQAADGAQGTGQGPHVHVDGEGGETYDGPPPVTGEPPKTAETPAITLP